MTIAFDALTNGSVTANNPSSDTVNHTPVGTPDAIIVLVSCEDDLIAADGVTAITYGGQTMTELTDSPYNSDASTEHSSSHAFILNDPPSGAQDCVVTLDTTTSGQARVHVYSFTTAGGVDVVESSARDAGHKTSGFGSAASVTLKTGGDTCMFLALGGSGENAKSSVNNTGAATVHGESDVGSEVLIRQTLVDSTSSSDQTFSFSQSSDRYHLIGWAFTEAAASGVTGTGAGTEGTDTGTGAAQVAVSGTSAGTEAADTGAAASQVQLTGTAAGTEGADTGAGSGQVQVSSTSAGTEGADTGAGSGQVSSGGGVNGVGSGTEAADTGASSGLVSITSSGSATESPDTGAAIGLVYVSGAAAATEAADSGTGAVVVGTPPPPVLSGNRYAVSTRYQSLTRTSCPTRTLK